MDFFLRCGGGGGVLFYVVVFLWFLHSADTHCLCLLILRRSGVLETKWREKICESQTEEVTEAWRE